MLETIRELGLDELAARDEREATQRRHARYFAALAEAAGPRLATAEQHLRLDRLDRDLDNLRAALARCLAHDAELGLALAESLGVSWGTTGHTQVGQRRPDDLPAIGRSRTAAGPAHALAARAQLRFLDQGERASVEEALAIYREVGDKRGTAWALRLLAGLDHGREADEGARALLRESMALERETGDHAGLAVSLFLLGGIELRSGAHEQARKLHEGCLELRRLYGSPEDVSYALGLPANPGRVRGDDAGARGYLEEALALTRAGRLTTGQMSAWLYGSLGYLALREGDVERARTLLRESVTIAARTNARFYLAAAILGLGELALERGKTRAGTRLVVAFETISPHSHGGMDPDERVYRDNCLASARATLGDEAFERARAEGRAMTLERAIAEALEPDETG